MPGWVSQQAFLAGYGAAQAVPGPLFTFSAYLGAIEDPSPNGVAGAAIALVAIFLPSFLLLGAALPLWSAARERIEIQAAVAGIGAAVVGLLAAALWDPVLSTSVDGAGDACSWSCCCSCLLRFLPPWAVVGIAAASGARPVLSARPSIEGRGRQDRPRQQERSIDVTSAPPHRRRRLRGARRCLHRDVRPLGRGARRLARLCGARRRHRHRSRAAHRAEQDHRAGARRRARRPDRS